MWVATTTTILRYGSEDVCQDKYNPFPDTVNPGGSKFYEDSKKRLWTTVYRNGVARFDREDNCWKSYPWPYSQAAFCMVEEKNSGDLYIGTWLKGIVRFCPDCGKEEDMFTPVTAANKEDERQSAVIALVQDNYRGLIWAATMRGLDSYRVTETGMLEAVDALERGVDKYQMLTDMTRDSNGQLWVAGYNIPSFVVTPSSRLSRYPLPEITRLSGHMATISSICHDGADPTLLWIFQERHRLYLYDTKSGRAVSDFENRFLETNNNLGNITQIISAEGDKSGVWVLSHKPESVYRLESNHGRISVAEQLPIPPEAGVVNTLCDDGHGNLYIAASAGLLEKNDFGLRWLDHDGSFADVTVSGSRVYGVRKLPEKGSSQVVVYSGTKMSDRRDFPNDLTAIAVIGDENLWIGDSRGTVLKIENNDIVKKLSEISEYVPSGSVQSIFADSLGNVWIQSDQQITEIDLKNRHMNRFYAGDPALGLFNFFSKSKTILPGGEILFGGTGGICKFYSPEESHYAKSNKFSICDITVDGNMVDLPSGDSPLTLPGHCKSVSIEFAIPDHFNASRIVYAYRLNENSDWIQLPQGFNVVHLYNIPKGKHDFQVRRVVWGDANQEASIIPLTIIREPKVYETWWFYIFVALAVIMSGFSIFRAMSARKAEKETRKMEEELIRLKFNFFTNITHELRTPLSLIITPLDALIKREKDPESLAELESIRRNADDLMSLINRILNFRRLEVGGEKLNLTRGNIVEFVGQIADNFTPLAQKKGVRYSFTSTCTTLMADFDVEKLKIILNNLMSNAFKFTDRGGAVQLMLDAKFDGDGTKAVLKISDTGMGISRNHLPHILEAFYQVGDSVAADGTAGSGIGLYLVKEYVDMHGGEISIKSKENAGTEITVVLPLGTEAQEQETAEVDEKPFTRNPSRKLILITEDNDEFRAFLRRELSAEYDILEAADGDKGLMLTRTHFPDLIISDVMMPRMDGFEFCRIVKSDPAICDIPVILLTARVDDASRMEGFRNRADSYLTKPFKLEMLTNRIEHLLESRRRRQSEFSKEPEATTEKLNLNPLDEKLISKVIECVDNNLDNSNYSIADLSSDVNMSRMNLYRKIMSITGQSPTDFVRTLRLKHAAKMLKEGTHSIVEIADATGFSSPSYFSRIFKSHFGKTPSQFQEES